MENNETKRVRKRVVSPILQEIMKEVESPEYKEKMRLMREEEKKELESRVGKTTDNDIKDLHDILVDTVCKFCKERGLTDINEVGFSADGIMGSIPYGSWQPCTDSSLKVGGLRYQRGENFPTYYEIGSSY